MNDKSVKDYLAALESSNKSDRRDAAKLLQKARVELFEANAEPNSILAPPQGNTFFEQLTCLGYYPHENRLEAVIQIKQRFGYAGPIPVCCTHGTTPAIPGSRGSFEYVAFYVNWNNDGDFSDQLIGESVGSGYVNVFDGPYPQVGAGPQAPLPISYAVYRDIIPSATLVAGSLVRVRAILSWGVMPTGPNFVPFWGNVLDTTIRIH